MHKRKEIVFEIVFLVSVITALYSIMTLGQVYVNADTSIAARYVNSVVEQHTLFPRGWYFVNNEMYVFNVAPIAMLTCLIFSNQSFARVLASAIVFILSAISLVYSSKKIYKNNAWKIIFPMMILILSGDNARDMMLYQAAYATQIIAFTFVVALFIFTYNRIISKENPLTKSYIIYAICTILMGLGGIRFLAELILPLLGAVVLMQFIKKEKNIILLLKKVLLISLPYAVGYGMFKYIIAHCNVAIKGAANIHFMDLAVAPDVLFENIRATFDSLIKNIGISQSGLLWFVGAAIINIVYLIIPVVQLTKIKEEDGDVQFFVFFGMLHNLEFLFFAVVLGMNDPRYLLSSLYISFIISGSYLWNYYIEKTNTSDRIIKLCTVVICILGVHTILRTDIDWQQALEGQKEAADILIEKGLTKGYGTYWNAYAMETYSDNEITTGAVTFDANNVCQYLWLTDKSVFNDDGVSTFLMIEGEEDANANLALLGTPTDEFEISGVLGYNVQSDVYVEKNYRVLVYPYDIGPLFGDSFSDGILTAKDMFYNDGVSLEDGLIHLHTNGMMRGPYGILEDGEYTITFVGENLDEAEYEIYSDEAQDNIQYTEEYKDDSKIVVKLDINDIVNDIQFRVYNHREEDILIQYVLVEKLG